MEKELTVSTTRFGFDWGPLQVERVTEHYGSVVINLCTSRQVVTVQITPSGLIHVSPPRKRG